MDKKFLTEAEAVAEFGLDAEQFRHFVGEGELRALADRGTWKFRRDEVEKLIREGHLQATSPAGDAAGGAKTGAGSVDVSFLELDEDALAEGATIVKKSSDLPEVGPVVLEAHEAIVADSDSDVKIAEGASAQPGANRSDVTEPMLAVTAAPASDVGESDSDSDVRIADSGVKLDAPDSGLVTDASGVLVDDSAIRGVESGVTLRPVDSGISLEGDSSLVLSDSDVQSGLPLQATLPDSGISLVAGDSGIRLDAGADSGIRLDSGTDSGISLEADSGIQLSGPGSDMPVKGKARSRADDTQPEFEVGEDEFDLSDQTTLIDPDEGDSLETLPPTKRPGKQTPSLSDAFDSAEVEDLDVVEEASELDVDAVEEDEDLLEASDEAFSTADEGEVSEEAVEAEAASVIRTAPREPGWGIAAVLPVAAAALLLAVNSLMLWDAMATMWTGDTGQAISSGIIDALGGLI